jgi:hypothetical protein
LNPGVYTIKNGQLFIGSNSRVTGTGVAFYLTGDSSTLIFFDSNAVIDLKAPQRGQPLAGILFYEDRNYTPAPPAVDPRRHQINSNTNQSYEGTVYLPQGELFVDSNGTVGTPSPFTIMIARRITADSNAMINMNSDFSAMTGDIPGQCTIAGNCGMLVQ